MNAVQSNHLIKSRQPRIFRIPWGYARTIVLLAGILAISPGFGTELTNLKGKSIQVEIQSVAAGHVTFLKKGALQTYMLPLSQLDAASRERIHAWVALDGLSIAVQKVRDDREGTGQNKTETWKYEITVKNDSRIDVEEVEIRCEGMRSTRSRIPMSRLRKNLRSRIPATPGAGTDPIKRSRTEAFPGTLAFSLIPARSAATKETKAVEARTVDTSEKYATSDPRIVRVVTTDYKQMIIGIKIEVLYKGIKVAARNLEGSDGRFSVAGR